ncbi:MAG: hypothetical protein QF552_01195 [Litorilituus sp.]|jgi:hypothetical protein|nr:hypothetical protein [Litorilituus sp.]
MHKLISSQKFLSVCFFTTTLALSGCKSTSEKFVEDQQQTQVQNEQFLIAKNAIENLQQSMQEAKEANIPYFALELYNDAKEEQDDANDKFDDIRFAPHKTTQSKTNKILADIKKAKQFLAKASLIKESAEKILAESLSQLETLKGLNADKLFSKEFNKSQNKVSDLIELIAEGKQAKAQEQQAKVLPLLNAIEIKAVKKVELRELRQLLATLKSAKINRISPISYQKTLGLAQTAESVIATNPKDKAAIRDSVALALFEAKHTQNITIAVRNLRALNKNDYEQYILGFENKLNSVSQALEGLNLRDQVLSEQTTSLVSQGESLNAQLKQQTNKIAQLEQSMISKDELILAATQDKDSFSTMIQAKLTEKNTQLEQQKKQLAKLMQSQLSLEQQITAANKEVALTKQQLEQTKNQHSLELAKSELASSTSNLSIEKKQLEFEKQIQALQTELTKAKARNSALNQETKTLNASIAKLKTEKSQVKQEPAPSIVPKDAVIKQKAADQ